MILLDSNVAIAAINDRPRIVADRIADQGRQGVVIFISSIVLFELRFGIAKSRRQTKNSESLANFLRGPVNVLSFDEDDAACAGAVRATFEAAGTPVGPYDVLIAGQALRHGATLVTANTREFKRVPGLKLEDWTKPGRR